MAKKQKRSSVQFLYETKTGRFLQNIFLFLHVPAILGFFLRSPLSSFAIKPFIKKHNIPMAEFEGVKFRTFNDFFTRKKEITFDQEASHLISPADSMMSLYPINEGSTFFVKGFNYTVKDLLQNQEAENLFTGGTCLVFRLRPTDYHRYCYIDSGKIGKNTFIPGSLHSVQPEACKAYRVYTLNRRSWALIETNNFGTVAQIEVGAFSVGGIINHDENREVTKGSEKGYFDLHGSTIVVLFQKDKINLKPELKEKLKSADEVQVKIGEWIGKA